MRKSLQPDGGEEQCSSVGDMSLAEKMALWGLDATAADNSPRHSLQLENNEIDCDDEQDDDDPEDQRERNAASAILAVGGDDLVGLSARANTGDAEGDSLAVANDGGGDAGDVVLLDRGEERGGVL